MIFGPENLYFRICGIVPIEGFYRCFYCVIPLALTCLVIASPLLRDYGLLMHYWLGVLPQALGNMIHLLMILFDPEEFRSILHDLNLVDDQLREMGALIQSPNLTKTMAVIILSQLFALLKSLTLLADMLADYPNMITMFVIINAAWNQHLTFAQLIHSRFSALNDQLTRIAASADQTLLQIVETRLDSVFRIHSTLHVIVSNVNSHFCVFNLFYVTFCFFEVVFYSYKTLDQMINDKAVVDMELKVIVYLSVNLVCQIVTCHLCANEANRTAEIAHHILHRDSPYSLWEKIGNYSRLTIDNPVKFTVGGIFTFNMELLTKIAAMSFSYLVIIFQLKDVDLFVPMSTSVNATGN
ncbi:uncharacterized protein LOC128993033 [Macrosteles quadrilineatus]|uniref:uncharacterized protein LOC128993033 n=1 Tax=Macrosteles quadrilineatus TaxID=74068 RepID=UPI0023E1F48A|nr:uncharacterized protein LOC128993033 [Macrosteles quadrilineatus]